MAILFAPRIIVGRLLRGIFEDIFLLCCSEQLPVTERSQLVSLPTWKTYDFSKNSRRTKILTSYLRRLLKIQYQNLNLNFLKGCVSEYNSGWRRPWIGFRFVNRELKDLKIVLVNLTNIVRYPFPHFT